MPTESAGNAQHPDVKDILFLVLIGFFLLAPWLSSNVVSLNAEERVWEVTKTMMRSKNFMVPYLNGEPHLTKPPMMYWLGAFAGFLLHREDPLIVRVPSMLCAIGAMCLTYLLGCRIKSRQIGFLAALVLVSSNLFTERSKLGTFDVALTAGVVLALYGAWLWTSSQKKSGVVLLFLGSWLGFMIKGPIAWLIIGIGVIGQLVMRKELKRLVSWRVLIFIVVLLVCSFLWFGYLIVHEPSARAVFVNELTLPFGHVGESSTAKHFKPFYQYLLDLPGDILPWTVYLPMIGWFYLRREHLTRESPLWFLFIWIGGNVLLFSIVPSKQGAYLLPLYPAIALIVSWCLVSVLGGEAREIAWFRNTNIILGIICFPAGITLAVLFWVRVGAPLILYLGVGILMVATGGALIWAAWRRNNQQALIYFLCGWLLLIPLLYGYFMPKHQHIHENRRSPEAEAYLARKNHLYSFFKIQE